MRAIFLKTSIDFFLKNVYLLSGHDASILFIYLFIKNLPGAWSVFAPPSIALAQLWSDIGKMCRVCWVNNLRNPLHSVLTLAQPWSGRVVFTGTCLVIVSEIRFTMHARRT